MAKARARTTPVEPARPTHKQKLLQEGLVRFRTHGFHGTTVDDLLAATAVPKGSFYHHFGSKDAFAQAVVEMYMTTTLARLAAIADGKGTGRAKLDAYFALVIERFGAIDFRYGCLVGSLTTELAPSSDVLRPVLAEALRAWRRALEKMIDEGQHDGSIRDDMSASQLGHVVFSLLHGALTLAEAVRTRKSIAEVASALPLLLAPPPPPRSSRR